MKVKDLSDIQIKTIFLPKDKNNREIFIHELDYCVLTGSSLFYPNVLLYNTVTNETHNPLKEKILSLENNVVTPQINQEDLNFNHIHEGPVFFFIYNTDNYFHFVYDTLPYLISFLHLKKNIKNLKLLMSYPNHDKFEFYKFVQEFLDLIGIQKDDILIAHKNVLYPKIYVSSSYTHDIDSNLPPREEIYDFYKWIVSKVDLDMETPENIYISRRTWLHNDSSNIGTNYTTRRKLTNEDELVELLEKNKYVEIFTEHLSIQEKIHLFNKAKNIIGAIGGGMVNVLFSNNDANVKVLISPTFLEKHERFKYSFNNKNVVYYDKSWHEEPGEWIKYMRIKSGDIVGEIENIKENALLISYTDHNVAGWNKEMNLKQKWVLKSMTQKLDNGLNCAWTLDLENLKTLI